MPGALSLEATGLNTPLGSGLCLAAVAAVNILLPQHKTCRRFQLLKSSPRVRFVNPLACHQLHAECCQTSAPSCAQHPLPGSAAGGKAAETASSVEEQRRGWRRPHAALQQPLPTHRTDEPPGSTASPPCRRGKPARHQLWRKRLLVATGLAEAACASVLPRPDGSTSRKHRQGLPRHGHGAGSVPAPSPARAPQPAQARLSCVHGGAEHVQGEDPHPPSVPLRIYTTLLLRATS